MSYLSSKIARISEKVRRLVIIRRKYHGDDEKQERINERLTRLYEAKARLLELKKEVR